MTGVIEINDEHGLLPQGAGELIQAAARSSLEAEGIKGAYVCMSIVDGEEIRLINAQMRNVDSETDVLSFPFLNYRDGKILRDAPDLMKKAYDPQAGVCFLGDIALNISRAQAQAEEFGHSVARETAYLTVHAMLHLMGYDHMTDADKSKMRQAEKRVMKRLGIFKNGEETMKHEDYIRLAIESLDNSYSPYSHFRVGACLVSEDGQYFQGANFENASLGATICAERCAVSNAIAHGVRSFTKIYIACDDGYAWPCGICRQVLNEFKSGDMEVHVGSPKTAWKMLPLRRLLPESFGPEELNQGVNK